MSFENYDANGYGHDLDLLLGCTNCIVYILEEVGEERKVSIESTSTFMEVRTHIFHVPIVLTKQNKFHVRRH